MQSPINPGDSGGAVVNDAGEVVGVVSGKRTEASLMSWCIAAEEVRAYLDDIKALVAPKTAADFHRRGLRTLERGQAIRAIDDLSSAYRLDPKSAAILSDRAMAYRARKDYELAQDDIAEALRLNPQNASAYNVRGCIATDQNDNDKALKDFRHAIQINPSVPAFHANRGQAHANKGEPEQAIHCYDEALRLLPDVAEWYYRRGMALEQLGQAQKAEQDYMLAIRLDSSLKDRLTLHKVRIVRVSNQTGQKIRVHIHFETQTADGRWVWTPDAGAAMWDFEPGEIAMLTHEGHPLQTRRMRIWAENSETKTTWIKTKDADTWTAPAAGYRSGQKPEFFTYTFNP